ncbi:hypothetical protein Q5752_006503 [Cryptotrichosporon argae]
MRSLALPLALACLCLGAGARAAPLQAWNDFDLFPRAAPPPLAPDPLAPALSPRALAPGALLVAHTDGQVTHVVVRKGTGPLALFDEPAGAPMEDAMDDEDAVLCLHVVDGTSAEMSLRDLGVMRSEGVDSGSLVDHAAIAPPASSGPTRSLTLSVTRPSSPSSSPSLSSAIDASHAHGLRIAPPTEPLLNTPDLPDAHETRSFINEQTLSPQPPRTSPTSAAAAVDLHMRVDTDKESNADPERNGVAQRPMGVPGRV